MRRKISLASLTVVSIITSIAVSLPEAQAGKSPSEYWRTTGLGLQHIKNSVFFKRCYASEMEFSGCVAALKILAAAANPKSALSTSAITAKVGQCRTIDTFGPLNWCEVTKPADEPSSLSAAATQQKELVRQEDTATRAIFQATKAEILACRAAGSKAKVQSCYEQMTLVEFDAVVERLWNEAAKTRPNDTAMIAGLALNAQLSVTFDPHTYLKPTAEFNDWQKPESLVGIGVEVGITGTQLVIGATIEGGPAENAGIQAGDIIVRVEGELISVSPTNLESVVAKIKGKEGTKVNLQISRAGKLINLAVTRKAVSIQSVSAKVLQDRNDKIGYIRLKSFNEGACDQIKAKIETLEKQNVRGLVFDLRSNGGGLLDEAICIGGLFAGKQTIVQVSELNNDQLTPHQSEQEQVTRLPMVTLIDSHSASASEVVSGALQDLKRSWIAGDRSYGKGSVQTIIPIVYFMADEGPNKELFTPEILVMFKHEIPMRVQEMKDKKPSILFGKTIQRFYQPSGRTNQSVGITPDFAIDPFPGATADDKVTAREEDMYTNALPAIGKPWVQTRPQEVATIDRCMKATGKAEDLFARRKSESRPVDYQLLKAQDLLSCTLQ